jgi:GT2 family glycosyltransferase
MLKSVSVVIIGLNEGERLVHCIQSVLRHRVRESIYVDSKSSDGSAERAEALGVSTIRLAAAKTTAALGRNAGWARASGEFVLFLDGDCELDPGFLDVALPVFADSKVAAVCGHVREIHPERSIYQRAMDLDWIYPPGDAEFFGGNVLMRRSALDQVGGFDAALAAGEEPELSFRVRSAGFTIRRIDAPMVWHDLGISAWRQYWRRAVRCGESYAAVARRTDGRAMPYWAAQTRRNYLKGGLYIGLLLLTVAAMIVTRSPLAALPFTLFFAGLAVRTALLYRWKSPQLSTMLIYGIHSHLVHVPLFVGQLRNRVRGSIG